jgi:hypothetical protein
MFAGSIFGGTVPQAERLALEVKSAFAGWLDSAEGGDAVGQVVVGNAGAGGIAEKHFNGIKKYEEITVTCGAGMEKAFYDWIAEGIGPRPTRKSGKIISLDANGREQSCLAFDNGLITEVGFPALDRASSGSAQMTVKIVPEITRRTRTAAGPVASRPARGARWLAANFRLNITGADTTHVNKIQPLMVKQILAPGGFGTPHYSLQVPDLVVTLPDADAASYESWFEECVVRGNTGASMEKSGTLEFLAQNPLDPTHPQTLFTLKFGHLGIFRFGPEKAETCASLPEAMAQMFCNDLSFMQGGPPR